MKITILTALFVTVVAANTHSTNLEAVVKSVDSDCQTYLTPQACCQLKQSITAVAEKQDNDAAKFNQDEMAEQLAEQLADDVNQSESSSDETLSEFIATIFDTNAKGDVKEQLVEIALKSNQVAIDNDGSLVPAQVDEFEMVNSISEPKAVSNDGNAKVYRAICKAMPETCAQTNSLSKRGRCMVAGLTTLALLYFTMSAVFMYMATFVVSRAAIILDTAASTIWFILAVVQLVVTYKKFAATVPVPAIGVGINHPNIDV